MNVYEKLLKVQQELKAPKNQYNKFGDFKYRNCEDILEAAKPLLTEVKGIILLHDDLVMIGSRYYIKATAKFIDVESADIIENAAFARETEEKPKMDAAQIKGSSSSYARKYALNGLLNIDDSKDLDVPMPDALKPDAPQNKPVNNNRNRNNGPKKPTPKELNDLCAEADRTGTDLKQVCERYKVANIKDLTETDYKKAMSVFSRMQSKEPEYGQYEMYFDQYDN